NIRLLSDLAVAVEEAGFEELWWPDHYNTREVAAVLTLCLSRTHRVRLGTAVTSVLVRHPAILASLFATLSEAAPGRIIAGLGPGGFEVRTELRTWTASPLNATRRAVAILRALTEGRVATLDEHGPFPVQGAKLGFEAPSMPVYLAGRGPRMIELAGEIADGLITHGLAERYLKLVFERVAAGAATSGRSPGDCRVVVMSHVAIDQDEQRARDALRSRCLFMVGGEYAEENIPLYGLDPEEVGRVRQAVRRRDRRASELITNQMVDAFAFAGPPEPIAERMVELAKIGVRSVILSPGGDVDFQAIMGLGKAFEKVMA